MPSIAASRTRKPNVEEVLATMSPEQRGMWQAAELNITHRSCTVRWCTGDCFWATDFVGGVVYRLHHCELPDGNSISQSELPPGEPTTEAELPALYLDQTFDDGLSPAMAGKLIADLRHDLDVMTGRAATAATLAIWAPPAWATSHQFGVGCVNAEHEIERGDAMVTLLQTDQMLIGDAGGLHLVRQPVTVMLADGTSQQELDLEAARAIVGTFTGPLDEALVEALAVYDGATR